MKNKVIYDHVIYYSLDTELTIPSCVLALIISRGSNINLRRLLELRIAKHINKVESYFATPNMFRIDF